MVGYSSWEGGDTSGGVSLIEAEKVWEFVSLAGKSLVTSNRNPSSWRTNVLLLHQFICDKSIPCLSVLHLRIFLTKRWNVGRSLGYPEITSTLTHHTAAVTSGSTYLERHPSSASADHFIIRNYDCSWFRRCEIYPGHFPWPLSNGSTADQHDNKLQGKWPHSKTNIEIMPVLISVIWL